METPQKPLLPSYKDLSIDLLCNELKWVRSKTIQPILTCLNSTREMPEQSVKSVRH